MVLRGVSRRLVVMTGAVVGAATMVMSTSAVSAQEPVAEPGAGEVPVPGVPVAEGDDPEALVPLSGVAEIEGGGAHTCARLAGGTAKCWGGNWWGQLGDGTTTDRLTPVRVMNPAGTGPLTVIVEIDAGRDHTCARLSNGTALCWGLNTYGALGDGTTTDRLLPVTVKNPAGTGPLTGIVEIDAGARHTCARLTNGTALCWGYDAFGALGDGTTTDRLLPVTVKNTAGTGSLTTVTFLATGQFHSCAVLADRSARCWGFNGDGRVGDGTTTTRLRPVTVKNPAGTGPLAGVASLGPGGHTCAVLTDRTARCWGWNYYGKLGDGTVTTRLRPVIVKDSSGAGPLTGVTEIVAGITHSCAVLADRTARCWGWNYYGALGDGTVTTRLRPVIVKNPAGTGSLTTVTHLATGYDHSCAVLADTTARCWGDNEYGQLGNGSRVNRMLPVTVKRGT